MQMARKIIDDEWIAAGMTREQLDQDEQLLHLFSRLVASGRSEDDINAEWQHKTPAEILREYAVPAPSPMDV